MKGYKCDAFLIPLLFPLQGKEMLLLYFFKGKFMRLVDALLDQTIGVFSEEAKTVIRIVSRPRPEFFTKLGKDLRIRCMNITSWKEEAAQKNL